MPGLPDGEPGPLAIAAQREVWITDDGSPLAAALQREFISVGCATRVVNLRELENPSAAGVGALVILSPAPQEKGDSHAAGNGADSVRGDEAFLKRAFALVRRLAGELNRAAADGGAMLVTVSRMDGAFGLRGNCDFDAASGGLAGLAKTAAREWPAVRCRAIDVSADWRDVAAIARRIVQECSAAGPTEIGLRPDGRCALELSASRPPCRTNGRPDDCRGDTPHRLNFAPGDVVIVTGGARGVTAAAAVALAQAARPTLVLLGRSPPPAPEPAWLAGLTGAAELKRAIIANEFADRAATPAAVEASFRRHAANREARQTLSRIATAGARVCYESLDVRDAAATAERLRRIRQTLGPIRGLVHGAGVLHDRRIEDKTDEQFAAVFDTKVAGLRSLLTALDPAELRCLVLFSSVSGRFGRQGQVDYAMANEVLNKMAQSFARRHRHCRVRSINWGPWEGGMVNDALKREFTRLGVQLIPLERGARAMVEEMGTDDPDVEVVIGGGFDAGGAPSDSTARAVAGGARAVRIARDLTTAAHPYLRSHVIGGRTVLPAAMMLEWIAQAAVEADGASDTGRISIGGLRILRGVVLNQEPYRVTVVLTPHGDGSRQAEIRGSDDVLHARCDLVALRGGNVCRAARESEQPAAGRRGAAASVPPAETIYGEVLFHGPHFQCINRVIESSRERLLVALRAAPPPAEWMPDALERAWTTDPLLIDGALQMGILWTHLHLDKPSLPSFIAGYDQSCRPPAGNVFAELVLRQATPHKLVADVAFRDEAGVGFARLCGVEWTADAALREAFRRRTLAEANA